MDEQLRHLERTQADDPRWIAAALRAGTLTHENVALAAQLGHEAACAATGLASAPTEALPDLFRGDAATRARIALLRHSVAKHAADPLRREALHLLEREARGDPIPAALATRLAAELAPAPRCACDVLATLREELVPWLLGRGDPIRDKDAGRLPHVVVIAGPDANRRRDLVSGDILGWGDRATFDVRKSSVSRMHCRFTEERGVWTVMDLGSSHGTRVNNEHAWGPVALLHGDRIDCSNATLEYRAWNP